MTASQRDEAEPFEPTLRPQFGLKTLALSLVAVSLTFALSRWLPAAIVAAVVFCAGLIALHVFSAAIGRKLRESHPNDRKARGSDRELPPQASTETDSALESISRRSADAGELQQRRSVASLALWMTVLAVGASCGVAYGWSVIADVRSPSLIVPAAGLAAFGFLGAVAGGLGHALAASLLIAHRQSVQASESKEPGR